jgi:hypothetical protein
VRIAIAVEMSSGLMLLWTASMGWLIVSYCGNIKGKGEMEVGEERTDCVEDPRPSPRMIWYPAQAAVTVVGESMERSPAPTAQKTAPPTAQGV